MSPCATAVFLLLLAITPLARGALEFETTKQATETKWNDTVVTARFAFQNSGPETVRILSLRPDCSCVSGKFHLNKLIYKAGEKGTVTLTYTPGSRAGPQHPSIFINTDPPAEKEIKLTLSTEVPELIGFSSRVLSWTADEWSSMTAKQIDITLLSELTGAEIILGAAPVKFEAVVAPGSVKSSWIVSLKPKSQPPDALPEEINLEIRLQSGIIVRRSVFAYTR